MNSEKIKRPFLAVRAIIANNDGKVLILKRANTLHGDGKWCLPGGNVEYGQSVQEAVKKEIKQEISFTCTDFFFLFLVENLPSEESDLHYVNLIYECVTEGTLHLNYESSDYAWIGPEDLRNYDIIFRNEVAIKRYWESVQL
jgi:mutator protein MutT